MTHSVPAGAVLRQVIAWLAAGGSCVLGPRALPETVPAHWLETALEGEGGVRWRVDSWTWL